MTDYTSELPLLRWFEKEAKEKRTTKFPGAGNKDYWGIYLSLHEHMNNHVHNQVEAAAAAVEPGIYLTKHGPEHIKVVIMRAEALIMASNTKSSARSSYKPALSPYEVFILLVAIHVHDIANRTGRKGHETRILEEASRIPALKQLDNFHLREIVTIAACHGGKGDKIGDKLATEQSSGQIKYRPQLIAAILKLADELADDRTRADLHGLSNKETFPASSLIFHVFAASLYSVSLKPETHTIHLDFKIEISDARRQFVIPVKKGEEEKSVYLIDYIYERTLKTYRELRYCTRFMRRLDCVYYDVQVAIEIYNPDEDPGSDVPKALRKISYTIGDSGYPDERQGDLTSLARNFDPSLTGEYIATVLAETIS
jgi:hypothetical protein